MCDLKQEMSKRSLDTSAETRKRAAMISVAASTSPFNFMTLRSLLDRMERSDIKSLCSSSKLTHTACVELDRGNYWKSRFQHECLVAPRGNASFFQRYLAGVEAVYKGRMSRLLIDEDDNAKLSVQFITPDCSAAYHFEIVPQNYDIFNIEVARQGNEQYIDLSQLFNVQDVIRQPFADFNKVGFTSSQIMVGNGWQQSETIITSLSANSEVDVINVRGTSRPRNVAQLKTEFFDDSHDRFGGDDEEEEEESNDQEYLESRPSEAIIACDALQLQTFAVTASGKLYVIHDNRWRLFRLESDNVKVVALAADVRHHTLSVLDNRGYMYIYKFPKASRPFYSIYIAYYKSDDYRIAGVGLNSFIDRYGEIEFIGNLPGYRNDEIPIDLFEGERQTTVFVESRLTRSPIFVRLQSIQHETEDTFFIAIANTGRAYGGILENHSEPILLVDSVDCVDCAAILGRHGNYYFLTLTSTGRVDVYTYVIGDRNMWRRNVLIVKIASVVFRVG